MLLPIAKAKNALQNIAERFFIYRKFIVFIEEVFINMVK